MASDAPQERFPLVEPEGGKPDKRAPGAKASLIARLGSERRSRLLHGPEDEAASRGGPAPGDDPGDRDPTDDEAGAGGRPRGRLLPILIALLALAGFGAVVWYAYTWGIGAIQDEELPVIRAEPDPIKRRPESPGGLEVPDQDKLVLNQPAPDPETPQVERLLPPPETPLPPKPMQGGPPAAAGPAPGEMAAEAPGETPAETRSAEAGEPAAPLAAPVIDAEPKAVEEPKLPPPPSAAPATAAEAPKVPAPSSQAEPAQGAAPAEPAQGAAPAEPTRSAAQAPAQTAARPAAGGFVVQLVSLKERDRVEAAWAGLVKAHPNLLGDRRLVVQSVDLGSRGTYHRVQAGTFPDRASAQALCDRLKARKQDCLVVQR